MGLVLLARNDLRIAEADAEAEEEEWARSEARGRRQETREPVEEREVEMLAMEAQEEVRLRRRQWRKKHA